MPKTYLEILSDLISDVSNGVPLRTGSRLLNKYQERKAAELRDIWLEEMAKAGEPEYVPASEDDAIAICLRVFRAANEGAARANLRLLAKVVAGQASVGEVYADEFLRFADALASLSREELTVIGTLLRKHLQELTYKKAPEPAEIWNFAKRELNRTGVMSDDDIVAAAARAQRSGLIVANSGFGGGGYQVTPQLLRLSKLVDFEDALRQEGVRLP